MPIFNVEKFQKEFTLREIVEDDFEEIRQLQLVCFPGMKPWTIEQLESHVRLFPRGQICVEYEGTIIASSSSLLVDFDIYGADHTWMDATGGGFIENHNPEGDTLYGMEIMVHPDYRGMKLARRLYDARKQLARELNLMRVVVGGRLPNYGERRDEMTIDEYVEKVTDRAIYDPVLTTQLANGFALKRIVEDYLDADKESDGYAAFLEWPNIYYRQPDRRAYITSRPVRICAVQYYMRHVDSFDDFAGQCEYFVDVASGYKSDFALFPEILTTQLLSFVENKDPGKAARELSTFTPRYLELFTNLAIRYNVNIVGGSHFVVEGDKLYNVSFLFKRNGEIEKQYKLHITPNERRWWGVSPGDKIEVFDTDVGPVNIQICYDVEFPEISRVAVAKGARIIFVPFCTDERHGYLRVRYCAQARCVENQCFAAIAGNAGNLPHVENMDIQYAQSAILTPSDFVFARDGVAQECTPNVETVVVHNVDLEALKRARKSGTTQNWNDRRDDLYEVQLLK